MAERFNKGDRVNVNGMDAELLSWPASNTGPFRYRTFGPGGVITEQTAFVSNTAVAPAGRPMSEGGGGQPVQEVFGVDDIALVQAAPPPPEPQPIDPEIMREIEREDAEAAKKKKAADKAALAAMRDQVKAELMAELRAAGVLPLLVAEKSSEDDLEPEAVNREVHEGEVVATKPEIVMSNETLVPRDDLPEVTFHEEDAPVPAQAQPWGRGRAARMHREVSQE